VIRSSGVFGEYRWGQQRKQALIGLEQIKAATKEALNKSPSPSGRGL